MWKLTKFIIKKNKSTNKTANAKPSPDEIREEKISYYRNLFRLDFRAYDEDLEEEENGIDDTSYFERGSSFSLDDEDVIYYQKKFASLDALDVFYTLCLDYCKDELAVLKKRITKYPLLVDLYAKEFVEKKTHDHKHKNKLPDPKKAERYKHNLMKQQMEKVERSQRSQEKIKAQIVAIKKKMAELGITPVNQKRSKVMIHQATEADLQKTPGTRENNKNIIAGTMVAVATPMPEITQ